MAFNDLPPGESDSTVPDDESAKPVKKFGERKKWNKSASNRTKLIQSIATEMLISPKLVQAAFKRVSSKPKTHPIHDENLLGRMIYPSTRGVTDKEFVAVVDAIADVYPEVFSGKTYGEVAENPAVLGDMKDVSIDAREPAGDEYSLQDEAETDGTSTIRGTHAGSDLIPGAHPAYLLPVTPGTGHNYHGEGSGSGAHSQLHRAVYRFAPIAIVAAWLVVFAWEEYRVQQLQDLLTNQIVKSQRLEASLASEKENNRPASLATLSSHVATFDPQIFYGSQNSIYEIGRIIPNNTSLYNDTNFVKDLEETIYSFDMFANTGGVVKERWMPILEDGLRRGVDYRIVLSDYRPENENFARFSHAVGEALTDQARGATIENHRQLQALIDRLEADKQKGDKQEFRGSLTVKWNDDLLLHTLWLRDGKQPRAIGHLGVHFYQGKGQWPCIRASKQTSPEMVENMVAEFETIWDRAKDYDFLPYLPVSSEPVRLLKPVAE